MSIFFKSLYLDIKIVVRWMDISESSSSCGYSDHPCDDYWKKKGRLSVRHTPGSYRNRSSGQASEHVMVDIKISNARKLLYHPPPAHIPSHQSSNLSLPPSVCMLLTHAWASVPVCVCVGVLLDYPWRSKRRGRESERVKEPGQEFLYIYSMTHTQVTENSSISMVWLTHFVCSEFSSHLHTSSGW